MGLFSAEPAEKVLKEFKDVNGIKEIEEILALENSKIYEKLVIIGNPIDSKVNLKYATENNEYTNL